MQIRDDDWRADDRRSRKTRSSTASCSRATSGSRTTRSCPEIKLAPRQIFTRSKVRADVARIIELYRRQGRFAADGRAEDRRARPEPRRHRLRDQRRARSPRSARSTSSATRSSPTASLRGEMVTKQSRMLPLLQLGRQLRSRSLAYRPAEAASVLPDPGLCRFPRRLGGRRADAGQAGLHHHLRGRGRRALQVRRRRRSRATSATSSGEALQPTAADEEGRLVQRQAGRRHGRPRSTETAGLFGYAFADVQPGLRPRQGRPDDGRHLQGRRCAARLCRADRHQRQHADTRTRSSAANSAWPKAMRSTRFQVKRSQDRIKSLGYLPGEARDRAEAGLRARPHRAGSQCRGKVDRRAAAFGRFLQPRDASSSSLGHRSATSGARARRSAPASIIRAIPSRSSSASPSPICSTRTSRSAATSSAATTTASTISTSNDRNTTYNRRRPASRSALGVPLTEYLSLRAALWPQLSTM